jgi:ankyrin repeat protein
VAERLLAAGADPDAIEDYHQSTPLGWAEFQRQSEVAELLRR